MLITTSAADPLPIEQMFYNRRRKDPLNPDWVGVRGTSKLEGGHPYYHASLPGTSYSLHLASAILDCQFGNANVKAAARIGKTAAHSLADAYQQEKKRNIIEQQKWKDYKLPASLPVPSETDERFGVDFTPGQEWIARAIDAQHHGRAAVPMSEQEEAEFFTGDIAHGKSTYLLLLSSYIC